jgi:hypothetical protein
MRNTGVDDSVLTIWQQKMNIFEAAKRDADLERKIEGKLGRIGTVRAEHEGLWSFF